MLIKESTIFLKLQKLRNESFHDSHVSQVQHIEDLIREWQEFYTNVTDASESWSSISQNIGDSDAQISGHEIV